ncbi:hypothetical protein KAX75_02220 [candidate division WOR-3 bacterium]|nr:hypothetical protein [candidate division WOR-3 bacterium]
MNKRNDVQKQNGIHLPLFGLANKLGGTCSFLPLQNDFILDIAFIFSEWGRCPSISLGIVDLAAMK